MWRRLSRDSQILSLMDLTTATPLEIAKRIIKRNSWDNLTTGEKRMCIYFRPSQSATNPETTNEVIQVDCHVPAGEDYVAYQVQARVVQLLRTSPINGRDLRFAGQLGELASMPSFVCVGTRFTYNSTI